MPSRATAPSAEKAAPRAVSTAPHGSHRGRAGPADPFFLDVSVQRCTKWCSAGGAAARGASSPASAARRGDLVVRLPARGLVAGRGLRQSELLEAVLEGP